MKRAYWFPASKEFEWDASLSIGNGTSTTPASPANPSSPPLGTGWKGEDRKTDLSLKNIKTPNTGNSSKKQECFSTNPLNIFQKQCTNSCINMYKLYPQNRLDSTLLKSTQMVFIRLCPTHCKRIPEKTNKQVSHLKHIISNMENPSKNITSFNNWPTQHIPNMALIVHKLCHTAVSTNTLLKSSSRLSDYQILPNPDIRSPL